ncbi:MAG: PAAR domain-containing protein [Bacteroidota bacterium]
MPTAVVILKSQHTCPMYDGSTPHVGGPCSSGSGSVFIEGSAVVRVGDTATCSSPSQPIIQTGAKTVYIDGQLAAIAPGSLTNHGGTIIQGGCTSVMIE